MKKTRFTEAQIMGVLRQMEGGVPAAELCREHGMSSATLYKCRAKRDLVRHWFKNNGRVRHGCEPDFRDEGDGGGEPPPEAHVCRCQHAE